jgi:hypothetical protein
VRGRCEHEASGEGDLASRPNKLGRGTPGTRFGIRVGHPPRGLLNAGGNLRERTMFSPKRQTPEGYLVCCDCLTRRGSRCEN